MKPEILLQLIHDLTVRALDAEQRAAEAERELGDLKSHLSQPGTGPDTI